MVKTAWASFGMNDKQVIFVLWDITDHSYVLNQLIVMNLYVILFYVCNRRRSTSFLRHAPGAGSSMAGVPPRSSPQCRGLTGSPSSAASRSSHNTALPSSRNSPASTACNDQELGHELAHLGQERAICL